MFANYKIVHKATLSVPGKVTKLTLYAVPGVKSPAAQSLKAVIYADSEGSPGKLLATGTEVTYKGDVNGSGWLELPLTSPVELNPGTYWIGFIDGNETEGMGYTYDEVEGSRAYNTNTYSSGPTNPFGTATKDSEQASIYATYTPIPVFGKTSVGAKEDNGMFANYKIVHKETMSAPGAVTKLTLYAIPGVKSPAAQSLKAVIYSDSEGSPSELLATGSEVTYEGNINGSGWFELPFASPVKLTTGTYWIGFIDGSETEGMGYKYDEAANSRAYNTNTYSSGPTNPFGTATKDSEQASIYATYNPAPENTSVPTITGTVEQGHTLTEHHGSWTGSPTSYSYQWQQCNSLGEGCLPIFGATSQTYIPTVGDVGHTLRAQEKATNSSGTSEPATSAATAEVTSPACTDTWTGPAEGTWGTAEDWSKGTVPTSTDVACIGSGKTVKVSEGTNHASVVQGEGTLKIREATLEVGGTELSQVKKLTLEFKGVLAGTATVQVSGTFTWSGGEMSGEGSTVVLAGASGKLEGGEVLKKRSLVNEGTLSMPSNGLSMKEGAELDNAGTFTENTEGPGIKKEGAGTAPKIVNTGTWRKTEGTAETLVEVAFDNEGTVSAGSGHLEFRGGGESHGGSWKGNGGLVELREGTFSLGTTVPMEGSVEVDKYSAVERPKVSAGKIEGSAAKVTVNEGTLTLEGPGTSTLESLSIKGFLGKLAGAGTLDVASSLTMCAGYLEGTGATVLQSGGTGTLECGPSLKKRTFVNEGTTTFVREYISMEENAVIENTGTFISNAEGAGLGGEGATEGTIINAGLFEKTAGTGTSVIKALFENGGAVQELKGKLEFKRRTEVAGSTRYGGPNPLAPELECPECGDPVNLATGNLSEKQTDLTRKGPGVEDDFTRYYNSQAGAEGVKTALGFGWSFSFSDHITNESAKKQVTVIQANGSTATFAEGVGGSWTAPAWCQAKLSGSSATKWTLTYPDQSEYVFAGSTGRLESESDRNGNKTELVYSEAGKLKEVKLPDSRAYELKYSGELISEVEDLNTKHTAKYTYEGESLATVTLPGEASARWSFKYDGSHQLTEMTDGREGKTKNEYTSGKVTKQTDPAGRETELVYTTFHTRMTNKNTGAVTDLSYSGDDEVTELTRGYGTSSATTEHRAYNAAGELASVTDGNGHVTTYGYDSEGNRTSLLDPNKHETKWGYDSKHDVTSLTTPKGEQTTIKRDSHGNAEVIERPAPEEKTQTTKYKYGTHGELETVEDPLKRVWKYEYDAEGYRKAEIDPESDKRTWEYNKDGFVTESVSPRGNAEGAEPSKYTTKVELDEQNRPIKVTDPLGHTTKYKYDGNGNLKELTDARNHTTTYTYNGDNQPATVKEPSGIVTETKYDGEGHVIAQVDGNKHETKYVRNILGQVSEVEDPLKRKTTKVYDLAGNLETVTDPAKRTTTYKYDPANRLTEVSYSDGKTHSVKYEYDADGNPTKMEDATGTSKYVYDQLDRLTESADGHKDLVKYEYDLANQQIKITYPNGKAVSREYDNAGRLKSVTDWSSNTTKFAYDRDSNLEKTTYPTNEDASTYNGADQLTKTVMKKGGEELASLTYARDADGQLESTTQKGLPGEEKTSYVYDENNRLAKGGAIEYKYDEADNPTKLGATAQTFNEGNELSEGTGVEYKYDELGERTKRTPSVGKATTYGYDQAGNLTSVEREREGEAPEINDSYGYDGNGLRASQTISGTTSYLTWDMSGSLPLLINDGTNSYVYGPGQLPIEQISSGGTVIYPHHDQQGSTRLLTSSAGAKEASFTYDAYGNQTGHTGTATTVLGYDGQYTNSDTGLLYLRARSYDPSTAQFLSVDPLDAVTGERYSYADDDPVNGSDPTGLIFGIPGTPSWSQLGTRVTGFFDGLTSPIFGGTAALRAAFGLNGGLDECSAEYRFSRTVGLADVAVGAGAAAGAGVVTAIAGAGGVSAGAAEGVDTASPDLISTLVESTGHLWVSLARAVAFPAVGSAGFTWIAGQFFSGNTPASCGCGG